MLPGHVHFCHPRYPHGGCSEHHPRYIQNFRTVSATHRSAIAQLSNPQPVNDSMWLYLWRSSPVHDPFHEQRHYSRRRYRSKNPIAPPRDVVSAPRKTGELCIRQSCNLLCSRLDAFLLGKLAKTEGEKRVEKVRKTLMTVH